MHFIDKFDGENIDGQHLRPPVLAILLETIEGKNLMDCQIHQYFPGKNCTVQTIVHNSHRLCTCVVALYILLCYLTSCKL